MRNQIRILIAAIVAAVSFGFFVPPAQAAVWTAVCDTNRGGFAVTTQGFTSSTSATNNCVYQLDANDGCWSGWSYWGGPFSGGGFGQYSLYKSRQKTSSWWCGNNTTPVNIRVWLQAN